VMDQGTVNFNSGPSGHVRLFDVLFEPSLTLNLCSGGQVTSNGAECLLRGKALSSHKGRTVIRAVL
jgi:hypothetical protein